MSQDTVPLFFLLAGFSKCGTTTLSSLLCEHPELFLPTEPSKEPWFFSHHFGDGWARYRTYFAGAYRGQKLGEASTSYSTFRHGEIARERILSLYPDIRLIFIARDPVDRIESSFREAHHSGARWNKHCPFRLDEALRRGSVSLPDSCFHARLRNYSRFMDKERIHVVLLEDLKADPSHVLQGCFQFLDVDPAVKIPSPTRRLNSGETKLRDTLELRRLRETVYRPKTGGPLSKINISVADQFLRPLGYREPFDNGEINWSDEAKTLVASSIGDDARCFLTYLGRPLSTWPRMAALLKEPRGIE